MPLNTYILIFLFSVFQYSGYDKGSIKDQRSGGGSSDFYGMGDQKIPNFSIPKRMNEYFNATLE